MGRRALRNGRRTSRGRRSGSKPRWRRRSRWRKPAGKQWPRNSVERLGGPLLISYPAQMKSILLITESLRAGEGVPLPMISSTAISPSKSRSGAANTCPHARCGRLCGFILPFTLLPCECPANCHGLTPLRAPGIRSRFDRLRIDTGSTEASQTPSYLQIGTPSSSRRCPHPAWPMHITADRPFYCSGARHSCNKHTRIPGCVSGPRIGCMSGPKGACGSGRAGG